MVFLLLGSRGSCGGRSFPSTIFIQNKIPQRPQLIVWYPFSNGWGFWGQNTHPGHVHLLVQMDIDLSRKQIHPAIKMSAIFFLKSAINLPTYQNWSLNVGAWCLVKVRLTVIFSNLSPDIRSLRQMGAPSFLLTAVFDQNFFYQCFPNCISRWETRYLCTLKIHQRLKELLQLFLVSLQTTCSRQFLGGTIKKIATEDITSNVTPCMPIMKGR